MAQIYPTVGLQVCRWTVLKCAFMNGVPARLGIVTIGVSDIDRSERFYLALGWPRTQSSVPGEIVWFATSHCYLGLFSWTDLAEDAAAEPARGSGFGGVTLAVNVGSEQEVDDALAATQQAGATIVQPATRMDWGGYRGYFADPDGHRWEVAHNPNFPIDAHGRVVIP